MNPLTITPLSATNVATNGNTVTPSTAPEQQNFAIPIIPTIPTLVDPGVTLANKSLAERLSHVITDESLDLGLIGDETEQGKILRGAAETLRRVNKSASEDFRKIMEASNRAERVRLRQESAGALKSNLLSLIGSLERLSPDEQAAICTAKLNANRTFPMLVARYAPEAAGELLDMISGLKEDVRAEILTAQNNVNWTLPMVVARHAPKAFGRLFKSPAEGFAYVVANESLSLDLIGEGVEHVEILRGAAKTLRQINQNANRRLQEIRETPNKVERVHLGLKLAGALNPDLLSLINSLKELNPDEQAAICTAKLNANRTFPMLVARYAPEAVESLLGTIESLKEDVRAAILTAQNNSNWTLPMVVAQCAKEAIGKLFGTINGLKDYDGGKALAAILTAQNSANVTFPIFVVRYAPGAVESLLGTINGLKDYDGGKALATIFTAQDDITKATLPMLVARYAPGAVESLLGTIESLKDYDGGKALATIFTAQDSANVTFQMLVARYVPGAVESLLGTINGLKDYDGGKALATILTAQNSGNWTLPMVVAQHAPGAVGSLLDTIESLKDYDGGKALATIFAAQNSDDWTFPMLVAQHVPGAIGRLFKSPAEKLAHVVANESLSLDLIGDGAGQGKILRGAAETLRRVNKSASESLQKIRNLQKTRKTLNIAKQTRLEQELAEALNSDLLSLIGSLKESNPDERAAICTARLSSNRTLPIFVAKYAPGAIESLWDTIESLKDYDGGKALAAILTAQDNDKVTFPMLMARHAPMTFEKLFKAPVERFAYVVADESLSLDLIGEGAGHVETLREAAGVLRRINQNINKGLQKIRKTPSMDNRVRLKQDLAEALKQDLLPLINSIKESNLDEQAAILTAQDSDNWTFPMVVAQWAPKALWGLLDTIENLKEDVRAKILAAQNSNDLTLPMIVAQRAPMVFGKLFKSPAERFAYVVANESLSLDLIEAGAERGGILREAAETLRRINQNANESLQEIREAPSIADRVRLERDLTEALKQDLLSLVGSLKELNPDGQAAILMAQNNDKVTFPMFVAQYAPEVVGSLLGTINGLDEDVRAKILAAQNSNDLTLPMVVAQHAPMAFGRLFKSLAEEFSYVVANESLSLDLIGEGVEHVGALRRAAETLRRVNQSANKNFQKIKKTSNKAKQVRLKRKWAKALKSDLLSLIDSLKGLNPDERAAILTAQSNNKRTLPVLVAQYIPGAFGRLFESSAERFAHIVANESLSLDLVGEGFEHVKVLRGAAETLRRINQNTNKSLQEIREAPSIAKQACLEQELAKTLKSDLSFLVATLGELNPDERVAILMAQDNGNWTFPMFVAQWAPGAVGELLDTIGGLKDYDGGKTLAKIFTAQDNGDWTFPMFLAHYAPRAVEKLLGTIDGLNEDTRAKILTVQDNNKITFPIVVAQWAPGAVGKLLDTIGGLKDYDGGKTLAKILTAQDNDKSTLPMFVAQRAPEAVGSLLGTIDGLKDHGERKALATIFTAQNSNNDTFPIVVAQRAPGDVGELLDRINGLDKDAQATIFTAQDNDKSTLPMLVARYAPKAVKSLSGMIEGLKDHNEGKTRAKIFTAQNDIKVTFPMFVAKYAPEAVESLLGMIEGLNEDIRATIFTARKGTFLVFTARHVPEAFGRLFKSPAEKFSYVVTNESLSLDLIGDGVGQGKTLREAAEALRRINQNANENFQKIKETSGEAERVHLEQELAKALKSDLSFLVGSLKELNPDEQAAICTAKLSDNRTFPMFVAQYVPEAVQSLLDTIDGLKDHDGGKTLAEIFTVQENVNWTFPIFVARYASGAVEKLLGTINGLNGDIQAKIFTAQNDDDWTFPMLVARYTPKAVKSLSGMIEGLKGHNEGKTLAKIFTAQNDIKVTFPMFVAKYAPEAVESLLGMIEGLNEDIRATIFTARKGTFLVFTARHVPEAFGRLFKSPAEKFSYVVTNESLSLDLIGDGVGQGKTLREAAEALRRINQNANENFRKIKETSGEAERVHLEQELAKALKSDLSFLVGSLKELNPDERAAICAAKLSDNRTFPALMARYAPEAVESLFGTIESLNKDIQAKIFTAQNNDKVTFPMFVAQYAPEVVGSLLGTINGLDEDVRAKILAAQNSNDLTLPMVVAQHAPMAFGRLFKSLAEEFSYVVANESLSLDLIGEGVEHVGALRNAAEALRLVNQKASEGFRKLREASNRAKRVRLEQELLEMLRSDLLPLIDSLKGLNPDEQAAMCTAKLINNRTFPMFVVQSVPEAAEKLLATIDGLNEDIQVAILTAQNNSKATLPMLVTQYASEAAGKLLATIEGLKDHDGGKTLTAILTAQSNSKATLPMFIARHAPKALEKLFDMMDEDTRATILTAQDGTGWTFPMLMARHAPKAVEKLWGTINSLSEDIWVRILTAQNNANWTFPMFVAWYAPGAGGRLLATIEGLKDHDGGKTLAAILTAQNNNRDTFSVFVGCYALGHSKKLLDMIEGLKNHNGGETLATIFTAQNNKGVAFPMLVPQDAPEATGKLLGMISDMDEDTRVKILTAQSRTNHTFPVAVVQEASEDIGRLFDMVEGLKGRGKGEAMGMILARPPFPVCVAEEASPEHVNRFLDMIEGGDFAGKRTVQRIIFSAGDRSEQSFIGAIEERTEAMEESMEALGADILARAHELAGNCTLIGRFSKLPDEQKITEEGLAAAVEDFHKEIGILRGKMLQREEVERKVAAAGMDALEDIEDWLLGFQPFPPIALLQGVTTALQKATSYTNACVDALCTGIEALEAEIKLLRLKINPNASPAERIAALEEDWLMDVRRSVIFDLDTLMLARCVGKRRLNEVVEVELLFNNLHKKIAGRDISDVRFSHRAKIVLETFVKLMGEVEQDSDGPGSNLFSSHGGSYTALRKHFLEGPNKKSYAAKLERIETLCPMEYPSPQEDDPDHKVSIGYDLIEPVAMLMFAAQERNPFISGMLGEGTLRQLVDPKRIPVAALPEKVKLRDECIELKEGFTELMNYIESHAKPEHVMLAPESAEPELADFASPPETEEGKKARLLAELQSELRALREDPASINFGIVSEIYNTLDLDELFPKSKPMRLRLESFLSPDFEVALRAAAVQSEAEKYLDWAML